MLATVCGKKFEKRMLGEEKNESVDRPEPPLWVWVLFRAEARW